MNQHMIIGNLVHDPETGATESGVNWCRFKVAVRKKYKPKDGQPDADFIRVTAWRGLGDTCAKYLKKGKKVAVVGVPGVSGWVGQDGEVRTQLELTADDVEFLSSSGSSQAPTDADAPPAPAARDEATGMEIVETDEQPF